LLDWNDSHFQFALTCRYFRDLLQERADAERKRRREDARTTTWYAPSPERLSRKYGAYFETTLQSYTYISTHDFDDEMYSATIDDLFGDYHHKLLYESADHVKWLFGEARSTYCREAALATTPQQSSRERWDVTQGEQHVMELAAIIGDLGLIKWLRSQDPPCEWSKKACTAAAWANRWDLLRLLLSIGCPIDKEGILGWSRVNQGTLCPTVGTESLKFSSGFSATMDAFLVTQASRILRLEKWSGLQVSVLTFHLALFSSLITDIIFLLQSITMTWNA